MGPIFVKARRDQQCPTGRVFQDRWALVTSTLIGNPLSFSGLISVLSKRESTRKAIGDDETQYQEVQTSSFLFPMFFFLFSSQC